LTQRIEAALDVRIDMPGADHGQELLLLFRWLSRDPDARRYAPASLDDQPTAGTMGAGEIINVMLTQATSIASLAVAIASWRDSRAQALPVRIAAGDRSVIISGQSAAEARELLESLCGPEGPAGGPAGGTQ
jgi:hypothetical protein